MRNKYKNTTDKVLIDILVRCVKSHELEGIKKEILARMSKIAELEARLQAVEGVIQARTGD